MEKIHHINLYCILISEHRHFLSLFLLVELQRESIYPSKGYLISGGLRMFEGQR